MLKNLHCTVFETSSVIIIEIIDLKLFFIYLDNDTLNDLAKEIQIQLKGKKNVRKKTK